MPKANETHTGTFQRVRWRSPENEGNRMIAMLEDGSTVLGTAQDGDLIPGITYQFYGNWSEHPTHGRQFNFRQFVVKEPHGRAGVIAYLERYATGVGPAVAARIWDSFGTESVATLRTNPESVVAIPAIGRYLSLENARLASFELREHAKLEDTRIELVNLFDGRGFPHALVEDCIGKWKIMAPNRVRRDPFSMLVNGFAGCGFARCDRLYQDLGLPLDRLKRQVVCLWHILHSDTSGSTWLPLNQAWDMLREKVSGTKLNKKKAVIMGCRAKWLARRTDPEGVMWLAEGARARSEAYIAARVVQLSQFEPVMWPSPESLTEVTDHQRERYALATQGPVAILSGNPGSGKTFASGRIIKGLLDSHGSHEIAVCAPTGKAAQRITEVMLSHGIKDIQATTIHRLLEVGRNGHDQKGWGFRRNEQNPLAKRFVFADEMSMCSTSLCASLIAACRPGTHILFVGDFAQLPPVEHGCPLKNMIAAGLPHGELTKIERNSGDVTTACQDLKEGRRCQPSPSNKIDIEAGRNYLHIECARPPLAIGALTNFLRNIPDRYDRIWDVQILCAVNEEKSPIGRKALNKMLQRILNGQSPDIPGSRFRLNDKVICLSNGMLPTVTCPECHAPANAMEWTGKAYVCGNCTEATNSAHLIDDFCANGEMGTVTLAERGMIHVEIKSPWRTVRVAGAYLDAWDQAYAVTTHKSQGSQWPVVVVMIDDSRGADWVTSWEHFRTSLSRMERLVVTIGKQSAMYRQCQRSALAARKTFLKELIQQAVGVGVEQGVTA